MDNVGITRHATKRMKERAGISKSAQARQADLAIKRGYSHCDTVGSLNRYLTNIYLSHGTANNIKIYGNKIYLFHNALLITVLNLPNKYFRNLKNYIRKDETDGGQPETL